MTMTQGDFDRQYTDVRKALPEELRPLYEQVRFCGLSLVNQYELDKLIAALATTRAELEALARRAEEAEEDAASWRDRYAAVIACIRELQCPDVSPCLDAYEGDDLACSRCYDLYADRLLAARERSES